MRGILTIKSIYPHIHSNLLSAPALTRVVLRVLKYQFKPVLDGVWLVFWTGFDWFFAPLP